MDGPETPGGGRPLHGPSAPPLNSAASPLEIRHRRSPCAGWRLTMRRNGMIARSVGTIAAPLLVLAGGCTSMKVTGTPRTGTEQLLLTCTWDAALRAVDFRPLAGSRVFLDP